MNFSFFRKWGGAGTIRATQIAEYLGGRVNPTEDYENDICIYVKIMPPEDHPKTCYLDLVDGYGFRNYLLRHTDVGLITQTKRAQEHMLKIAKRQSIVIPEHHCNFEREQRTRKGVTTVGIIGGSRTFNAPIKEFNEALKKMDLQLLYHHNFIHYYKIREDVVNFYRNIDIQVVYRTAWIDKIEDLANPLKLENAGSFGIPTVSYPEKNYIDEWQGSFIEVTAIPEMLEQIRKLKEDPVYYQVWADKARDKAEPYHIEHISKLYTKLLI